MRYVMAAGLAASLILPLAAHAQAPAAPDPTLELVQDWAALNREMGHLQKSLGAYIDHVESRLKWVLDNWVAKPEASGTQGGTPSASPLGRIGVPPEKAK